MTTSDFRRGIGLALAVVLGLMTIPTAEAGTAEQEPTLKVYAFFATWCVPCRVELPHIDSMAQTYAERGVEVRLVSIDGPSSVSEVPVFLDRLGIETPFIADTETELLSRYHPAASVPFTVITDVDGTALFAHVGYEPGDEALLEAALQRLLAEAEAADTTDAPSGGRADVSLQTVAIGRSDRFDPVDDGELFAGVVRLELGVHNGPAAVRARVDGALLHDPSPDDSAVSRQRDATRGDGQLERASIGIRLEELGVNGEIVAGDSYGQLAHGLVLSLRRVDPLGLDTAIRGVRLDVSEEWFYLRALGGSVNPQDLDPIALDLVENDPSDWLVGAETGLALGPLVVGPELLVAKAEGAASDGRDLEWLLGGGSLSLDLESMRLRAESAAGRRSGFALEDETPWAMFVSLAADLGPVHVLLESKVYRHWTIGLEELGVLYHEPPTLERDDQQVPSNSNVAGGRGRVDWRMLDELSLVFNWLSYRYTLDEGSPFDDAYLAHHGYGGVEWRPAESVSVSLVGGARTEDKPDGSDRLDLWHLDLDGAFGVFEWLALTAKLNHVSETKVSFSGAKDFVRGLAVIGVAWPGVATASLLYGYSTEEAFSPTHYPAGEIKFGLPLGGEVRLLGGRLAGGRVCVSGSCRDVPPFEGGRIDAIVRF